MNPFDSGSARRSNSQRSNSGPTPARAPRPEAARWIECDVVAPDVVAYFDGQADDESALRARRHLDACSGCARMWRDWGDTRLLLRTSRLPEMPVHWPASLVQRARLQAMLPALFAAQGTHASTAAADDAGPASNFLRAPRELRQVILARTTRAAAEEYSPLDPVDPNPIDPMEALPPARLQGRSRFETLDPSHAGRRRARRYRIAARACASALAAWMLTLASLPPTEPTARDGQAATFQAQPEASMESPRRSVSLGFASPLSPLLPLLAAARRRAQADLAASEAAPEARPAAPTGDGAAPPTLDAQNPASQLEGAPGTPPVGAEDESLDSGGATSGLAPGAPDSAGVPAGSLPPIRVAAQPIRPVPNSIQLAARTSVSARTTSSTRTSGLRLELSLAPRNLSGQNAAISLAASVRQVADLSGEDAARASTPTAHVRPRGEAAQSNGQADAWEGAEHEPLALSRELNDTRPTEIGDAMDAYAATYVDEDEGSL